MKKAKALYQAKLKGFSLIEVSLVLLIIGIMAGAMLKGKDLIESSKLKSIANDIQDLQLAYTEYVNLYGAYPGNDISASSKFNGETNGSGDGKTTDTEAKNVFSHLYAAGLIGSKNFKTPKIGGNYDILAENGTVKLQLSNQNNGFLSGKQAISLIAKISELLGNSDDKIETDPTPVKRDSSDKYKLKIRIN